MAYQIAFDLYESATQQFLNNILQAIKRTAPIPAAIEGKPLPGKQISEHNLMMNLGPSGALKCCEDSKVSIDQGHFNRKAAAITS